MAHLSQTVQSFRPTSLPFLRGKNGTVTPDHHHPAYHQGTRVNERCTEGREG